MLLILNRRLAAVRRNKEKNMITVCNVSVNFSGTPLFSDVDLKKYVVFDRDKIPVYTEEDVIARWEDTFNAIEADIAQFLSENPNPDRYCPQGRTDRIYELMMDIHAGNLDQALEKIELFKANPNGVIYSGPKGYDYEYIERWCKK